MKNTVNWTLLIQFPNVLKTGQETVFSWKDEKCVLTVLTL